MTFLGVIPSRYNSTRFPGKPLIDIDGKSMIQRVYEQSKKSSFLSKVIVATDDERIYKHVQSFGGDVIMTSVNHKSGTDRCAEVLEKINDGVDVVINIQGDEPFINPQQIDLLCSCFDDSKTEIATLIKRIENEEDLFNPNRPKVDVDENMFAKMFSRKTIPVLENIEKKKWISSHDFYKHIGIYGYRSPVLKSICELPESPLEKEEQLEQLRWLENGHKIKTAITTLEAIAIDTPEDLDKIAFK